MSYEDWRDEIFGRPENFDPVLADLPEEVHQLDDENQLEFINLALLDPEIHTRFSPSQIGIGLNIIFSNTCSDISYCYVMSRGDTKGEQKLVESIKCLSHLYSNYFVRYCTDAVEKIGEARNPKHISFICYMLWDIFVLDPVNATPRMIEATVNMMSESLEIGNDNCIESLIHGLGHWVDDTKLAYTALEKWLNSPSTNNKVLIDYAIQAKSGHIQ